RKHLWTGNVRVALFLAILVLGWWIAKTGFPSVYWLGACAGAFVALAIVHRRILRAKSTAERAAALYRRGIARIEDRWAGAGDTGEQFHDPEHVYAGDLDIFGEGSLFQLLCAARTRMGKENLANWLTHQGTVDAVLQRHSAVTELAAKLDLREDLAVAGESDNINADPAKLRNWAGVNVAFNERLLRPVAMLLAALSVGALGWAIVSFARTGNAFWTPFLLSLIVNGFVVFLLRHKIDRVLGGLDQAYHNLEAVAAILKRLEQENFAAPHLQRLQQRLMASGRRASYCIGRLDTLCDLDDSRHNMVVQLLNVPLLYSVQLACALQRWRRKYGPSVAGWLDALGEMEALLCLGTYSWEHPDDPFPEFAGPDELPSFAATAIGHPLLPAARCVRNDVAFGGNTQVLLVSGSNMSGKSTLLRAIGTNTVLALMGAPVRAQRLRLSATAVAASMRLSDSLQKGVSHFYAEISRIRKVVDLSACGPLLILFDEILQGTNSHDRRTGAEGIVKTLLRNGAIGLVTTHDLALTELAERFPGKVVNVHFQEKLESGRLSFDYRLREGVVTTSNGVELMKSIGLDV
ncbi:MAG TPA: hypothetical protein VLT16_05500, partial [Candidatus Limnocylindrales bacterium]|nr:hypothetical protein [Candidatus Limnocylindrales bacterium]